MQQFQYSTLIDAPVEVVWGFHERPDVLELLTPPWQPMQVVRREGGLDVGAISEFRIFIGPLPLRWLAVHTECITNQLFIDQQQEGPFKYWLHRHLFAQERDKTRLTDSIEFTLPGGWLVELLLSWLVKMQLEKMFRYRHKVTQRECTRK
ncbi:MAG: SRPBCC family protein [Symploca sp. SIO2B6]|nr:SRPBCC family protein [Symploca sp. SIO2B6]